MALSQELKDFLEEKYLQYNTADFIANDPVGVPHRFNKKQDIEIAGLMAAIFAWGQRKTIINKATEFLNLMDNAPHDFVLHHSENDLKPFKNFKHRTFNGTDALYFIHFLNWYYQQNDSLEEVFIQKIKEEDTDVGNGLNHFFQAFFSLEEAPQRTKKHIASPSRKSACKRINMYLRWMVRADENGVDFGIWKRIKTSQLVCPCDVHVERVARALGLIQRKQMDWKTAIELTDSLKKFDANDPVKYDYALFGMGVEEKY